jgi:hypothetical protein
MTKHRLNENTIELEYPRIYMAATSDKSRAVLTRVHFTKNLAIAANGFMAVVCKVTNHYGPIAIGKRSMQWMCGRSKEVMLFVEKLNGRLAVNRRAYKAPDEPILAEDFDEKFVNGAIDGVLNKALDQADTNRAICLDARYLGRVVSAFGISGGRQTIYIIPTVPSPTKPKPNENELEKKLRKEKDEQKRRASPVLIIPAGGREAIFGIVMPMHIGGGSNGGLELPDQVISTVRKNIPGLRSGDAKQIAKKLLESNGEAE